MKKESVLPFKEHMLLLPMLFVLVTWLVFWVEVKWDISFNKLGVLPREFSGLKGILFSPFIHGDISHLWHNTMPLLILSTALFYFYNSAAKKVLIIGFIFTGIGTWVLGRTSYHIGASGIIYMLFGFLLLKGLLTMHLRLLAVSFFVVFVYGGMIWYVAPVDFKISWEGHLSGLLVGFFLALSRSNKEVLPNEKPKYAWESPDYDDSNDLFMQCFDENGRFVPTPKIELIDEEITFNTSTTAVQDIRLIYERVPDKKEKKKSYFINYNLD